MLPVLLFAALLFQACSARKVTIEPYNMAQEVGKNVTIACIVSKNVPLDNVQWKFKQNGTKTFNALTFNQNVLGTATKYALVSTYNLTVMKLTSSDEGTYRCLVGLKEYDMNLTVVDLPSGVKISWASKNSYGSLVNLTCTAPHGRPPAPLRWVINGKDYTDQAISETTSVSASGYGDSVSNLPLYLDNRLKDKLAQCFVSYDGWDKAMNASYTIQHNGVTDLKLSSLLLSAAVVLLVYLW